jgi:predicted Zn finger-like uncharacterized protein
MRLVCPSCEAEYEVDDAAIPLTGRDVQCSNCGHAWFQTHPEVEAEEEADVDAADWARTKSGAAESVTADDTGLRAGFEAEVESVVPDAWMPEVVMPVAQGQGAAGSAGAPAVPPPSRSLDETVLAMLREEAEREAAARRHDAAARTRGQGPPAIETQTELPLVQEPGGVAAAVRRIARGRGGEHEQAAPPPKSRREMLPAIEEINSTLRATSDRTSQADAAILDSLDQGAEGRGGFRRGFLFLVTLAVALAVLYVFAPVLAAKVPALAGIAAQYVQAVDAARLWLDAEMKALIAMIQRLTLGQSG